MKIKDNRNNGEKMKKEILIIEAFLLMVFLIVQISALDIENQYRLDFGHVVIIQELKTEPATIVPGNPVVLSMIIENTGSKFVGDIIIELDPPDEIAFLNDVSKRKITRLNSGRSEEIKFNIIV